MGGDDCNCRYGREESAIEIERQNRTRTIVFFLPETTHACVFGARAGTTQRDTNSTAMTVRGSRTDGRREESAAPLGSGSARGMGVRLIQSKGEHGDPGVGGFVCTKNETKGRQKLKKETNRDLQANPAHHLISFLFPRRRDNNPTACPSSTQSYFYFRPSIP